MVSGKNLRKLFKELHITQEDAAQMIGRSRATIITWLGKEQIDDGTLALISEKLGIDLVNWVPGKTLVNTQNFGRPSETTSQKHSQPRLEAKPISLADPYGEFGTGEKIYELPDGQKIMEVKIVPVKGQAGYLRGFPDPEYYEDLPTMTVQVNNYHRGSYLAFEVKGDSMTPTRIEDMPDAILEGWFVVGREVLKQHWHSKLHTHSHSYWIIVHKTEGILIKNINHHDVEKGTITIHSLNEAYEDEELELEDIEQIFSGVKRIVNDR